VGLLYLGRWGSAKAERAYRDLVASWATTGGLPVPAGDLTVEELIARFLTHCESYYVGPDGEQTSEVSAFACALGPMRDLFADELAADFGPLKLRMLRDLYVECGYVRSAVNKRVSRVRQMFKWAVSLELLEPSVLERLRAVAPLRRGRTSAPEPDPVRPPEPEAVEAVLAHVGRQVAAMIRLQLATGMRPGEVVLVRPADIDRGGDVWTFKPLRHKDEQSRSGAAGAGVKPPAPAASD